MAKRKRRTDEHESEAPAAWAKIDGSGRPTDPAHPWNSDTWSVTEMRERTIAQRLGRLEKAWRAGNPGALLAAFRCCERFEVGIPMWLRAAAIAELDPRSQHSRGKGRTSRPEALARENYKHFVRWDAVRELKDRADELSDIAMTDEARWDAVSELLAGTEAAGSPESIRRSYRKVERAFEDGEGARFNLPALKALLVINSTTF